jgi:beta-N-acetylhexosaminidase
MIKRLATVLLWILGFLLTFMSANIYDPYLLVVRGAGDIALFMGGLTVLCALVWRGYARGKGISGKLLILLWCLPPIAMLSAVTIFQMRKHEVLHAEGKRAQELGRHFIVGYSSFDEVAALAAKGLIGGIYVAHHNVRGRSIDAVKAEIANLQSIRRTAGLPPLIVSVDQEGGIVSHMSPLLTSLPSLSTLTTLQPDEPLKKAESFGRIHGQELADIGITLNFAPVVDLLHAQPRNPFDFHSMIGRRAISEDPDIVSDVALAYVRGLEASGIEGTLKHFPGLGRIRQDTHHFRADLDTPVAELDASDWRPFRQVLARSNAVLMVGHLAVTALDPASAASHSKRVVTDLIRDKWGYQGIVVTDDFVMGPIYEHGVCKAVVEALNAGVDLLLVAYDGLQFYRMYNCAWTAPQGSIDETMLQRSAARLDAKLVRREMNSGTPNSEGLRD